MKINITVCAGIVVWLIAICSCNNEERIKVVLAKFPNDSIQEVIYYNLPIKGDSTGVKEIYFDNGKLHAKGNYKNGKRDGKWICYRRNGTIEWRADYKNGKENGVTECYEENGSWRRMTVVDGCKNGPTSEYNTDSTGREVFVYGQYKNCKEDSLWVWKDKNQRLLAKEFYTQGKPDKLYEIFYANGAVQTRAYLRVGFIDSLQSFDTSGKLIETKHYTEATWTHE